MANYTIQQCLGMNNVPENVKEWLTQLSISKLPTVKDRVFTAQNQGALATLLNKEYEKYNKAKTKRDEKKQKRQQCFETIKQALQVITADELLPKLEELKETIENEKKFKTVDKAIEASGMTKEQLIEYLTKK